MTGAATTVSDGQRRIVERLQRVDWAVAPDLARDLGITGAAVRCRHRWPLGVGPGRVGSVVGESADSLDVTVLVERDHGDTGLTGDQLGDAGVDHESADHQPGRHVQPEAGGRGSPPHMAPHSADGAMGEGIAIDAAGNVYTAEAQLRGVTKYVKP